MHSRDRWEDVPQSAYLTVCGPFDLKIQQIHLCAQLHLICKFGEILTSGLEDNYHVDRILVNKTKKIWD